MVVIVSLYELVGCVCVRYVCVRYIVCVVCVFCMCFVCVVYVYVRRFHESYISSVLHSFGQFVGLLGAFKGTLLGLSSKV